MPKKRPNLDLQPNLISEPQTDYTISSEQLAEKETYRQRLADFLKDPKSRQIEGFPIGEDEDILALSDPPYYTACPNPFMGEIIEKWQQERKDLRKELGLPDDSQENGVQVYHREPFAADVSEGKNDPIYNAHSYHTKVPHKAVMRYILHYTDPGDIIFDGFCGTGMSGVATRLCNNKKAVEELGYRVDKTGRIWESNNAISRMGSRKIILNDLSPAAAFIAYNYNIPIDSNTFEQEAKYILRETEKECGWMFETYHPNCDAPNRVKGRVNYTIWSDVFICPSCGQEMVFWDVAINKEKAEIADTWPCANCNSLLAKSPGKSIGTLKVERAWKTVFDHETKQTSRQTLQVPVLINYSVGKNRFEKRPDEADIKLIQKIEHDAIPYDTPIFPMMFKGAEWGDSWRSGYHSGITFAHHFYTRRNWWVICSYIEHVKNRKNSTAISNLLLWAVTGITEGSSKLNRERLSGLPSKLAGTLYIGSTIREINSLTFLARKTSKLFNIRRNIRKERALVITTQSSTNSIFEKPYLDYIFIDPPFGENLMYSELNFLWEVWLKVFTNNKPEAIINRSQHKRLVEYQELMQSCFDGFSHILKPGRWMTIEFHNSQNAVWNSIQEAILQAGFMVADVRTLDKQQGSFKQVTTTSAVKQDLVISAYKPSINFEQDFKLDGGSVQGTWSFLRQHLEQLPLPAIEDGVVEILTERQAYLLYDRMVAFHLVRGLNIPLSASEFYQGLSQKFLERDGMYFTPAQAADYDKLRMKAERVEQLALFVTDEKSAVQWLRQELNPAFGGQPQTYQDLQPKFLQQLHQERHEKLPELREILEENFLQDETECWYTPDPEHQADLEKLRDRLLLREFTEYLKSKGKLRIFRSEAVRAGFSHAWRERDYSTILEVAERLPEQVLQEDPALKIYYDNALHRADRQPKQDPLF